MQTKIAPPSRLTERLHDWGRRLGYPVAALGTRWLPRWLQHWIAHVVITLVMAIYPGPRRAISSNLAQILGKPVDGPDVRKATAAMIRNFGVYWCDLICFGQRGREQGRALVEDLEGWHHVEAAREEGNGAILMTAHLGNWEVGGFILGHKKIPVSVVYVPDKFAETETLRSRMRAGGLVEEIPLQLDSHLGSLPILRALRANRLVALQGDRDFNDTGRMIDFFGRAAPFPTGPFQLAYLTGAPLLPFFITYTEQRQLDIVVHPPIEVGRDLGREDAIDQAMQRWVTLLESVVSADPTQWYTFYPFWGQDVDGEATRSPEDRPASTAVSGDAR